MTRPPPAPRVPPAPAGPGGDDPVLASALATWRRDVESAPVAPRLAERVMAEAARRTEEYARFRRLARWYGAAATLTAAAGLTGALLASSGRFLPLDAPRLDARPPSVAELEAARVARLGDEAVAHLVVGTPAVLDRRSPALPATPPRSGNHAGDR